MGPRTWLFYLWSTTKLSQFTVKENKGSCGLIKTRQLSAKNRLYHATKTVNRKFACSNCKWKCRQRNSKYSSLVNILAWRKSKARSRIWIVPRMMLTLRNCNKRNSQPNSTEILQLHVKWNCTRFVIYARPYVYRDFFQDCSMARALCYNKLYLSVTREMSHVLIYY